MMDTAAAATVPKNVNKKKTQQQQEMMIINLEEKTTSLEEEEVVVEVVVSQHIRNVYVIYTMASLVAILGGFLHFRGIIDAGILTYITSLALITLLIIIIPFNGKNQIQRSCCFYIFAFFMGINLSYVTNVELIKLALLSGFMYTIAISMFVMLFSPERYHLGSYLILIQMALICLIFRDNLHFSFLLFCCVIIYDTHRIFERAKRDERDCVSHAMGLFFDFVEFFFIFYLKEQFFETKMMTSSSVGGIKEE